MPLRSSIRPILSGKRGTLAINSLIESMRQQHQPIAEAFTSVQSSIHAIESTLRNNDAPLESLTVADPSGRVIARVGGFAVGPTSYSGAALEALFVGPGADPNNDPFLVATDSALKINNAIIIAKKAGKEILIDPSVPVIIATTIGAPGPTILLAPSGITLINAAGAAVAQLSLTVSGGAVMVLHNADSSKSIILDPDTTPWP